MRKLILWFSERRLFTVILCGVYLVLVVLLHKPVSNVFDWMRAVLSFKVYNQALLHVSLLIAFVFAVFVGLKVKSSGRRSSKIMCWLFTALLVVASYKLLIVFNIEMIHYPQYAIPTVLIFALVMNYRKTVLWTTLIGALDEAYQAFVIYRDNNDVYLDFNDIILNLVGAGIGVALIYTLTEMGGPRPEGSHKSRRKFMFPFFLTTALILIAAIFLHMSGLMQFYPGAKSVAALIVLSRKPASAGFWTVPTVGKLFHILTPTEGILSIAALIGCYSYMDYAAKKR